MHKNFYSVHDIDDARSFVERAMEFKFAPKTRIGEGKTLVMIFFNASLRTRLSTEIAAKKLGMDVVSININDAWQWELEDGSAMIFDTVEHIRDAAQVIGRYCDLVAIRAFPSLRDRESDYADSVIKGFMKFSPVPVINMESAIRHPLQSMADLMTIEEYVRSPRPKIVLSWAPHVKALPQAVANSFLEWCHAVGHNVVITHPEGYELADEFTAGHQVEYDRERAFEGADVVYVKNWSSFNKYGQILSKDPLWMITADTMSKTNNAAIMHCLPVRRNLVAADEVLDGPTSLIYPQAENRLYAALYVLKSLLEND